MSRRKDLAGRRYGRLVAVSVAYPGGAGKHARWLCQCDCGNVTEVRSADLRRTRSCGCIGRETLSRQSAAAVGPLNPNWKGGFVNTDGYMVVSVGGRKRMQHRLVMEEIIGRALLSSETVHHRNGNRLDNRHENLELWTSRHCGGGRVSDQIEWAREILALYGHLF